MFFELVSILFAIVPDYGNECMTKENKNWTSFKNFAPKLNSNHNIYIKTKPDRPSQWQKNLPIQSSKTAFFPKRQSVKAELR